MSRTRDYWVMFSNPIGLAAAKRQLTTGHIAVMRHGQLLWEHMCYNYEGFSRTELVEWLQQQRGLARRTAYNYVQAFLAYIKATPDDFEGPASKLTYLGGGNYCLTDNPRHG